MIDAVWLPIAQIPAFNWLVLACATLAFVVFYARDYAAWGWLSFNSFFFGFNFFLKIVVMYPFALSANNLQALGRSFEAVLENLDHALYITLFGFAVMLCGMAMARLARGRSARLCEFVYETIIDGWYTPLGVTVSMTLALGLSLLLLALGFEVFVGRNLVFERTDLRPIFNFWTSVLPFCAINAVLYGYDRGARSALLGGLAAIVLGLIGGTRTVVILTLMQIAVVIGMNRRFRNPLFIAIGVVGLAAGALAISELRTASIETQRDSLGALGTLLFGNNLSDLRDFAWILSGMHDQFLWGKTYLAGYLSFIPSYLWDFRIEYSIGRVTPALAGMDPFGHGGLRPPIFGEMYVNFGLPGVGFGALLYGYMVGRVMIWVSGRVREPGNYNGFVVVWTGFLVLLVIDSFVFTPSFFDVYVLGGLLMVGRLLRRTRVRYA
jgi:oligosaccharide repeat unit polymerase